MPKLTGRRHELKTWPEQYAAIVDGRKLFEVRRNDRAFMVGDLLDLREFDPGRMHRYGGDYTGRVTTVVVTYILPGGSFELPPHLCVLGISPDVEAWRAAA